MAEKARYRSILVPGAFAGRTVVVTGGGSGIGRCVAHELASLGAAVVITGRRRDKLDAVAAEITEDGGRVEALAFDIRDEAAVKEHIAAVVARRDRIDGLVNNAGGQFPAPAAAISKKGFEAVVATNLTGTFLMMREVYDQSMRENGGAIVNMSADIGRGMAGMAHSGAARAGVENLTKTAAYEWAGAGVRVNCVAPGWIASSGMDTYEGAMKALIPKLEDHVPLGRLGLEAEVSTVICFLLSPAAAYVTGVTVPINGGSPLGSPLLPVARSRSTPAFDGFHRASTPKVLGGEGA
ncbi:MAG: citronellol catabolism dehydrogenase [Alphaproteobacteria bacterium]|nr:MAG: citronellol catabolism dehydrogenase [Alphaproteobacteria bacterium]